MPVQKCTLLFQLTTTPPDRTTASPHTGGWSETWWSQTPFSSTDVHWQELVRARALLLPEQASIVGLRFGLYTIVGNRFVPGGSTTGRLQIPGNSGAITDLPQVALEMAGSTNAGANHSRFNLRCIPDVMMQHGEYQPSNAFKRNVVSFGGKLVNGAFCFVGRDLTKPVQRVISIANNVVTVTGLLGAVVGTDSVRLLNVKDNQGNPVKGAFRIVGLTGFAYTVIGLDGVTAGESGSARVDAPVLLPFASVIANRAVVRKIGRPFEGYRGRASNR